MPSSIEQIARQIADLERQKQQKRPAPIMHPLLLKYLAARNSQGVAARKYMAAENDFAWQRKSAGNPLAYRGRRAMTHPAYGGHNGVMTPALPWIAKKETQKAAQAMGNAAKEVGAVGVGAVDIFGAPSAAIGLVSPRAKRAIRGFEDRHRLGTIAGSLVGFGGLAKLLAKAGTLKGMIAGAGLSTGARAMDGERRPDVLAASAVSGAAIPFGSLKAVGSDLGSGFYERGRNYYDFLARKRAEEKKQAASIAKLRALAGL